MSPPPGDVDADFAEFVRARQHQVLRAAYLVCGDTHLAEDLALGAFTTLALHWRQVKDDIPDTYVRSALYRDAISARHTATHDIAAVDVMAPKQRAITVLRHFEHRSERDTSEIVGTSVGSVRSHSHLGDGLDGLLADVADPVVERDFVDAAWAGADVRRHRRRRLGVGAVLGVVALAAVVTLLPKGNESDGALPAPGPSSLGLRPTGTQAQWNPGEFDMFDVATQVGPDVGQIGALPKIDDLTRSQLALPDDLTFGPETVMPSLREVGNNSAPVRAVLLRLTPAGVYPVLVRPTLSTPFMEVDTLVLASNVDEGGNTSEPLEVKAVADDRRHVMFLQSGKVLVLDAFSGDVKSFPVADKYLEGGGWAADGTSIVAWSETSQWRITPSTGVVQRLGREAYPGRHRVVIAGDDSVRVLEFDQKGANTKTVTGPRVLSDVWGATFSNVDSRVATGGFLSQPAALAANRRQPARLFQGVFAVDSIDMTSARLLLAPGSEGVSAGCCEVLGWAYNDQVLIRWNSRHLLAWNAVSGALTRVSTLPDSSTEGSPLGRAGRTVALAP